MSPAVQLVVYLAALVCFLLAAWGVHPRQRPAFESAGAKHIGVAPIGLYDDLLDIEAVFAEIGQPGGGVPAGVDVSALADLVAARIGDRLANIVADVIHDRMAR